LALVPLLTIPAIDAEVVVPSAATVMFRIVFPVMVAAGLEFRIPEQSFLSQSKWN